MSHNGAVRATLRSRYGVRAGGRPLKRGDLAVSGASQQFDWMSFDDFEELLADKPRNERWELIGGRVVRMMVGARWEHARIVQNIARRLGNQFDAANSSCQAFTETFFMKSRSLDAAMLPNVIVICGDIEPGATSVDTPSVLFEVLSPGTKARDRIEKWQVYQRLPSLQHYVLVARDRAHLEVHDRVAGQWNEFRVLEGLDTLLELPAIGVALPLREIYQRVFET